MIASGHSLAGVWIEISTLSIMLPSRIYGHSLAGVWIEIPYGRKPTVRYWGHSLAGVWIEILKVSGQQRQATRSLPCGSVD